MCIGLLLLHISRDLRSYCLVFMVKPPYGAWSAFRSDDWRPELMNGRALRFMYSILHSSAYSKYEYRPMLVVFTKYTYYHNNTYYLHYLLNHTSPPYDILPWNDYFMKYGFLILEKNNPCRTISLQDGFCNFLIPPIGWNF